MMIKRGLYHCLSRCPLSILSTSIRNHSETFSEHQNSSNHTAILKQFNKLTHNQQLYLNKIKKDYEKANTARLIKHSLMSEKFISKFSSLYEAFNEHCTILDTIIECHELLNDYEMRDLAKSEISSLNLKLSECHNDILFEIEQSLQSSGGSIFLEIRSAAGGAESSVFAADLFRAYEAVATNKGYKWTVLDNDIQAKDIISQIVIDVSGPDVSSTFQFEGGVHRVQRVPFNDTRTHTSTVAVVVSPKPNNIEIKINPEDLEISYTKSSGPGGQNGDAKKTKCQILHKPTDVFVTSQSSRHAWENKDDCMKILNSILLKKELDSQTSDANQNVKNQVKHGDRGDKIRTYNYKSGLVVDHRYKVEISGVIDYLNEPEKFSELHKKVSAAWQLQQLADIASSLSDNC